MTGAGREDEIAATQACVAAALRVLARTAIELASDLEHGAAPGRHLVADLEGDLEAVQRAIGELARANP